MADSDYRSIRALGIAVLVVQVAVFIWDLWDGNWYLTPFPVACFWYIAREMRKTAALHREVERMEADRRG